MKQLGLGLNLSTKKTRKREFLEEMERVVPWAALVQIVEPHCPRAKTGRPPFAVETLMELLGLAEGTPPLHEAGHRSATLIGDEFRRAEAAWRWARALAYGSAQNSDTLDRIVALATESIEIAARLDIKESAAGAALARSIASAARKRWDEARTAAREAWQVFEQIEDEWGGFLARREGLRALIGGGIEPGTISAADFDELSLEASKALP